METAGYLRNIDTRVEKAEDTTFDGSKLGLHSDSYFEGAATALGGLLAAMRLTACSNAPSWR